MKAKRFLALLLSVIMVLGMMPMTAFAYHEESFFDGDSVDVCTEGKTYSLFTEDNLEEQDGTTFLYVVKKGDRYYTLGNPRYTEFKEVDSVFAVDITEYYDAQTNSFSGISDNVNIGAMQYQMSAGSYMYVDGNMLLALSVPFESEGETWFEGGIRYYSLDNTYSYNRPLWHANGDGTGYFYDSYIDWMHDSDEWVYGVLDLKYTGTDYVFALRDKSAEYTEARNADPDNYDIGVDVVAYLYAAPCGHEKNIHSEAVAPTCMDKGCEEYWYCCYCGSYFADEAFQDEIGHIPVLPALDHSYGATGCTNCGRPTPVYTKITSYEQFLTLDPNASFIAVAEIDNGNGGKDYYVLKKEIATTMADIDEDGQPDILLVDDNSNGISDILETDENGDGVADAMEFDGVYSGEPDGVLDSEEIWEYLFYLENEYTDGYIPGLHIMGVIPVTPAADGTISVKGLDALEWIMERKYSDDELEDQYYGDGATVKDYENDFTFRIPNFWIRPVVTIDNNFYQQPYEQGDSKWWGVLFGKDGKELNSYLYEPIYGEDYPDDAVILYTESFHNLNSDGQLEHALRFLVNGEKKNFIMTSDSFWEELEGTQYPIYLYCSDAGEEYHEHIWGPWTKMNEENHKRVCTVDGCTAFDIGSHNKDENRGCTPDTEDYELGHWVSCTDCGGEYHEYHTREEAGRYYPNYWRDTGDGVHHVVYCTECGGPVEYAEHRWSDWYRGAKQIDGEWVMGHYRDCENWPCEAQIWQAECIYDEGTVTKEPTCTENGIKEYVCTADDCACDTKYHTEEIPALGHDWGEWTPSLTDSTKEERVCKRDPSHTEERTAHEHSWSNWVDDHTTETHTRQCTLEGCTAKETEPHNWDSGVQSGAASCTEGAKTTYTCSDCGATKTETGEELGHDWGEWVYDSVDSHIRNCKRNCGVEEEFEGHEWGEWQVYDENTHRMYCDICHGYQEEDHDWNGGVETVSPTCYSTGVMTYTCGTCGHTKTEEIPMTEHTWTDWAPNGDENHKRECMDDNCGAVETLPHSWDDGVVTVEPSCTANGVKTYTCQTCMHTRTEDVPTTDHIFGDWTPNNDGKTHSHFCSCNESETADHKFDDGEVTQAPTHEAVGEKKYTCSDCGYFYTEDIPALTEHEWGDWVINKLDEANTHIRYCICNEIQTAPHNFDDGVVTEPATHTSKGVKTYTCGDCGYSYDEEIPTTPDHEWTDWSPNGDGTHTRACRCNTNETKDCEWDDGVIIKQPTHYEEGVKTFTCTVCGGQKTDPIAKITEHEWTEWTPDNDGKTHTRLCKCGASETKDHSFDEGKVTEEATHTSKGVKTYTCGDCGYSYDEEIPTTPDHEWTDWSPNGDGTHTRACRCNANETKDCEWDDGVITKQPTHFEEGVKTFTCTVCGDEKTEPIAKTTEHEWTEWTPDNDGKTHTRLCKCGASETKDHSFDEGKVTEEATHTSKGVKTYTCGDCGYSYDEEIPTTPDHEWTDWSPNGGGTHTRACRCNANETKDCTYDDGVVTEEPTHVEPGTKFFTCTICGHTYEEDIPVLTDHEWGDWVINKLDEANTHIRYCICNEIQTAPHNFDDGVVTEPATHTSKGIKTFTCTDGCGYSYTEEIPTTPDHEWTDWSPNGDGTHTRACRCNANETKDCEWDDGVITKQPTHYEEGVKTFTCTVCKATKTESIAKTTVHEWGDWAKKDDKSHIRECKCGTTETKDHAFDAGTVTKEPTHLETGVKKFTCDDCGFVREDVLNKTPEHTFGEWKTEATVVGKHYRECACGEKEIKDCVWNAGKITKEPTHYEEGVKTFTCTVCGGTKTETIAKTTAHEWGDWAKKDDKSHIRECKCGTTETKDHAFDAGTVTKEPTHLEKGVKKFTCADCGFVREDVLNKTPEHTFGEWKTEATVVGKHYRECACGEREIGDCVWDAGVVTTEPTYESTGTKTYTCTVCGGTKTEAIDMLVKAEEIVSPENSDIKITTPEGSNAVLNENTVLKVEEVKDEVSEDVKANVEIVVGNDNAEVLASYDISLILDGATVQPGGTVEVTLPAPENAADFDTLQVVYIDDDGNVTPCETRVNADGTVTFVTDHFSHYAIVGVQNSSPIVWILISAISVALIAGAVVAVLVIKKKKGIA